MSKEQWGRGAKNSGNGILVFDIVILLKIIAELNSLFTGIEPPNRFEPPLPQSIDRKSKKVQSLLSTSRKVEI